MNSQFRLMITAASVCTCLLIFPRHSAADAITTVTALSNGFGYLGGCPQFGSDPLSSAVACGGGVSGPFAEDALASASASPNTLRGGASAFASGAGTDSITASGVAAFTDVITVFSGTSSGFTSGYVTFEGYTEGTLSTQIDSAEVSTYATVVYVARVIGLAGECFQTSVGTCLLTVPITFGQTYSLYQQLGAGVEVDLKVPGASGFSSASFMNTAGLSNILIYDANMNLLTDAQITADSGFIYPVNVPSTTPIPEPASLMLCATGCAGLAAVLKKRRVRAVSKLLSHS